MDGEVKNLKVVKQPGNEDPNPAVIKAMRQLLRKAEKGEIQGFATAIMYSDPLLAGYCCVPSEHGHIFTMIGAIDALKKFVLDAYVENPLEG